MNTKRDLLICLPFFAAALLATYLVRHNSFFWDTTQLGSQHAHFFYENHFKSIWLPDEMDSGHPPFFGFYLAAVWSFFGKSLTVSHFAMLPFLWGIIVQTYILGKKWLDTQAVLLLPFLFVNPILASQSILISPDIPLVFFFLWALNGVFYQNKKYIAFGVLGLAAISMRGMMSAAALGIFELILYFQWQKQDFVKRLWVWILPYLGGALFALLFLIGHYNVKGWIGFHTGSVWAGAFERVDFQGFIRNVVVLIWRFLDFGFLFVWLFLGIGVWKNAQKYFYFFALLGVLMLFLCPSLVLFKGLLTHRYLLPIYMILLFLSIKIIVDTFPKNAKIYLFALWLGLFSGNFWIYPQPIATGWDATLGHLPYYDLRQEMILFIDNEHITYENIGTAFPLLRPHKLIDLDKNGVFAPFDSSKNTYVLWSNISNDFSAEDLIFLNTRAEKVKILRGGQVEMILYKIKR